MPLMLKETLSGLLEFELVPNLFEYIVEEE